MGEKERYKGGPVSRICLRHASVNVVHPRESKHGYTQVYRSRPRVDPRDEGDSIARARTHTYTCDNDAIYE